MCRLFLSINSHYQIKDKIYKFLNQSIHEKKNTPLLNNHRDYDNHKDGFGLAWLRNNNFEIYKNSCIYTEDKLLNDIINFMPKDVVIGHIRRKSIPITSYNNTHPFKYKNNIFCHNGIVKDFHTLLKYVNYEYMKFIKGETDSEIIFYLYLSLLEDHNYEHAMNELLGLFIYLNIEVAANFIFANPEVIVVTRYLINANKNDKAPSLYIDKTDGVIISSEPVTNNWELINENTILIFDLKNLI
jgi:predicted glutamine amidotransferase